MTACYQLELCSVSQGECVFESLSSFSMAGGTETIPLQ